MVSAIYIISTIICLNCFIAMNNSNFIFINKHSFCKCNYENDTLNTLSKKEIYDALSGNSLEQIDNIILELDKDTPPLLVNAYKGALNMKKAAFLNSLTQKLNTFNQGKALLETEITKLPLNVELRFLRLIIQENAPALLKYNSNLQEDKQIILLGYKKSDEELKTIINNYSKKSKILTPDDLN